MPKQKKQKKKIDRYRCAKCPACGRMMKKTETHAVIETQDKTPYLLGLPHGFPLLFSVWVCMYCTKIERGI